MKKIENNNKLEIKLVVTKIYIKLVMNNSCTIFKIHRDKLNKTVLIHDVLYSKWINKLKDKNWCTKEILYQLATIIKDTLPENRVDWDLQFYMIECEVYNRENFSKIKNLIKDKNDFHNLFSIENRLDDENLKFNENDSLKFINKTIHEVETSFAASSVASSVASFAALMGDSLTEWR